MKRKDFRHLERLRVRWPEVDMQRIVFNGHYLAYVDTAMAGYWRALALPYQATFSQLGGELFVRKATLDCLGSAEYDDQLEIGVRHESPGNSSLRFAAGVFRGEQLLVSAELVYVFAEPQSRRPASVPAPLRDVLSAFEAGQPMLDVRVGDWAELGAQAQAIRHAVFVQEQGIPAELEWDEADADCVHALAVNRMGLPLGTGRLLPHVPGVAKIGRMAVRRDARGAGVGQALLRGLMQAAAQRGDQEVLLHAQASAAAFYARQGYVARGPVFEEAGIDHLEMVCSLR